MYNHYSAQISVGSQFPLKEKEKKKKEDIVTDPSHFGTNVKNRMLQNHYLQQVVLKFLGIGIRLYRHHILGRKKE